MQHSQIFPFDTLRIMVIFKNNLSASKNKKIQMLLGTIEERKK